MFVNKLELHINSRLIYYHLKKDANNRNIIMCGNGNNKLSDLLPLTFL